MDNKETLKLEWAMGEGIGKTKYNIFFGMSKFVFHSILKKNILFFFVVLFFSDQINKILPYWYSLAWWACVHRSVSKDGAKLSWKELGLSGTHSSHYQVEMLEMLERRAKTELTSCTSSREQVRKILPQESRAPKKRWGREDFPSWTTGLFIRHHIWVTKNKGRWQLM